MKQETPVEWLTNEEISAEQYYNETYKK